MTKEMMFISTSDKRLEEVVDTALKNHKGRDRASVMRDIIMAGSYLYLDRELYPYLNNRTRFGLYTVPGKVRIKPPRH